MHGTRVQFEWQPGPVRFRSGVSLHSHTHCSKESLSFIYRVAARIGFIEAALERGRRRRGSSFDLNRGWWTPPLVPAAALQLEREQIESRLGLEAMVSLMDHDSIEAPLSLLSSQPLLGVPVSVEWTVPFGGTFFHLGVHNLPGALASRAMAEMAAFTAQREPPAALADLLDWLSDDPQTLIVFNHPLWDESEVGVDRHRDLANQFLRRHAVSVHAFELNGLRPWRENACVADFARAWAKPLISGGDRHGLEPNSLLNLTNAASFPEFVDEIRCDRRSEILVTAQYRQSMFWRMFDAVLEAVGDHESHGLGWISWNDRVFYQCDDGVVRSLRQIWGDRPPRLVNNFTLLARTLYGSRLKSTLQAALARPQEVTL